MAPEKFSQAVRQWRLFCPGEKVLAGVSGGVDSVVLLHLLLRLPESLRPRVTAAHFNHRLRGRESDRDEKFVVRLCRDWKIPLVVGRAPVWKKRSNLEARARELRYNFLKRAAFKRGIRKIVTAHHADDQAETFLIRWLQGAGLKGLSGIRLVREEGRFLVVRPLLFVTRKEIEATARHFRLAFRVDSSNKDSAYLRNRVRRLLVSLRRENPKLSERTAVNSIFLQADQAYLESAADSFYKEGVKKGRGRVVCSIKRYLGLPAALRYRLLQRMARELCSNGYALPSDAVLKIDELVRATNPSAQYALPHGIHLRKDYVRFEILRPIK